MPLLDLANDSYVLPAGKLANVATKLELKSLPSRKLTPWPQDLTLVPAKAGDLSTYRALFRAVGGDHLWFSRLLMPDDELLKILSDPGTESFTLMRGDATLGILELNFRKMPDCELAFFGLVPEAIGSGIGRALVDEAIRRAFQRPIARFWLSTCTLDHPQALAFYRRSSFVPYARHVEIHDDPRHTGKLPHEAAPQIPLLP